MIHIPSVSKWDQIKDIPQALIDSDNDGIYENLKVLWDLVQSKPSTFPPSSHQHGDADLLGIDWTKVLNKPSAYPASGWRLIGTSTANGGYGPAIDVSSFESLYVFWQYMGSFQTHNLSIYINGNSYSSAISLAVFSLTSTGSTATETSSNDYIVIAGDRHDVGMLIINRNSKVATYHNLYYNTGGYSKVHISSLDLTRIPDSINTLVPYSESSVLISVFTPE